jgi:hypothetical protein
MHVTSYQFNRFPIDFDLSVPFPPFTTSSPSEWINGFRCKYSLKKEEKKMIVSHDLSAFMFIITVQ